MNAFIPASGSELNKILRLITDFMRSQLSLYTWPLGSDSINIGLSQIFFVFGQFMMSEEKSSSQSLSADKSSPNLVKIPVTILTGFLGAGKTTLLSRLVRECSDKRIAVIQNEVSEEMGIESAVVTDSNGNILPDFFELPNGCICCTAKDDIVTALDTIVSLGRERIDAVVVETTGVADPCSVAEIFWVDSELCSSVYLDGIVAVVDCANFSSIIKEDHILDHGDIGRRQVAVADRILMNKTDLVDPGSVKATRELINSINPSAEVLMTERAAVDPNWVLSIGSFGRPPHLDDEDHMHQVSKVDHVFVSLPEAVVDKTLLDKIIGDLLWESACGSVYRAKGLFRSRPSKEWHALQAVGALFETNPLPAADQIDLNRESCNAKFLFIGKNLDPKSIKNRIVSCIVSSSSA